MTQGRVEVICGGMFSGKTEELLRRVRRETLARKRVQLFKHGLDERYTEGHVESHAATRLPAIGIRTSEELLQQVRQDTHVVGIDEVQFFDEGIVNAVNLLADRGIRVILAGLDMDFQGVPFGPMPLLLAIAEDVFKISAVCVICGGTASRSHRLSGGTSVIEVGAADRYEARCRLCSTIVSCAFPLTTSSLYEA